MKSIELITRVVIRRSSDDIYNKHFHHQGSILLLRSIGRIHDIITECVRLRITPLPLSNNMFVYFAGSRCPACLSANIEYTDTEYDSNSINEICHCGVCNKSFYMRLDNVGWGNL
jgi:hypothetical protein